MSELASVMFDGRCFETEVAQKLAVSHLHAHDCLLLLCSSLPSSLRVF